MKVVFALALCVAVAAAFQFAAPTLPTDWALGGTLPEEAKMEVILSLTQRNMDAIKRIAISVSTPGDATYGHHLSVDDLATLTAPTAAELADVEAWLNEAGVTFTLANGRDTYTVAGSVKQLSALFKTTIRAALCEKTAQAAAIAGDLVIPDTLTAIAAVGGLHGLPLPPRAKQAKAAAGTYSVTPDVIRKVYELGSAKASGSVKNRQAAVEFQGQYFSPSDLKTFFAKYVPNAAPGDNTVYKIVGQNVPGQGVEAHLDVQYIMGVVPGIKTEFWSFPGFSFCNDLLNFTSTILADADAPKVFSISYGWQGNLAQLQCQQSQVTAIDNSFAKLAAGGTTIIFASGDSGSGYKSSFETLYASWPASSPWVTSVGATRFINNDPTQGELASDQFGSGGGFCWHGENAGIKGFARPSYAKVAQSDYINFNGKNLPKSDKTDYSSRGTPDVAALGEGYEVYVNNQWMAVGGTSAATPCFAAIISLINDGRVAKGKAGLGFLNPALYTNATHAGLTDVTVGTNAINRGGQTVPEGFECSKGWDAATGFGTPIFSKLNSILG